MKLRSFVLAAFLFAAPLASSLAQVGISINIAPPLLPVVAQPPAPLDGYIWTPGYWGYGNVGYYWVPGVWVAPPAVGLLWTPPWWGWSNGDYVFNEGYWGPTVGFYGGIDYGNGYYGNGYWGGRWEGNTFRYNTAVTRVNTAAVHNTYVDRSVLSKEGNRNRASFNGPNGVKAEPTAEQKAGAENARKVPPTSKQLARREAASKNRNLQASVNRGQPKAAAIRSFNKSVAHDTGAKGPGAATAAEAGNKSANVSGRKGAGNVAERGNRHGAKNYGKSRNVKEGQARARFGKAAGHQRLSLGRHAMTPRSAHPGMMGAPHPQAHPGMGVARPHGHPGTGMPRPQAGGNRGGHAPAHQQGKPKR
jgi:hypothetical protein